jgi:hypothetical protein
MAMMHPDAEAIFARLRSILEPHAGALKVSADKPDHYCLEVSFSTRLKKGYPVAWVKVTNSYVSYHFIPIYMFPKLREQLSPELKARMQGKSCFNFKTADEALFRELELVTGNGFKMSKQAGFGPDPKPNQ